MFLFTFNILLTNLTYILAGKIFLKKLLHYNNQDNSIFGIFGIIIISFFALLINFFFPLDKIVNLAVTIFIILLGFFFKIQFSKKDVLFLFIVSTVVLFLLAYTNEYRPDAGLYHLPYSQILNENKIILGLSNFHFRFGHISIIQYLSSINYNFLIGKMGIFIPLASLVSFIYIYFIVDIYKLIKRKENFSLGKFFSLVILLYFSYKMNRYGEFGNDAPGHLLIFFAVSMFLYITKFNFVSFYLLSLLSAYVFLNKVLLGLFFLLPLYILVRNKHFFGKILFSLPAFFTLLWLVKNILISGCVLYPVKSTCFTNLKWTDIKKTEIVQIESEAWSKAWPENKKKNLSHKEFIQDFEWLDAWNSKHFKFILKVLLPFIVGMILIMTYLTFNNIKNYNKKLNIVERNKIQILYLFSTIGVIIFFLKFPIYRYGYSYIIILLFLIFAELYNFIDLKRFMKVSKLFLIICLIALITKQFIRIIDNYGKRSFFPVHVFIDSKDFEKKYTNKILENSFKVYHSNEECFYGLAPCTNYKSDFDKIEYDFKFNYVILYKS